MKTKSLQRTLFSKLPMSFTGAGVTCFLLAVVWRRTKVIWKKMGREKIDFLTCFSRNGLFCLLFKRTKEKEITDIKQFAKSAQKDCSLKVNFDILRSSKLLMNSLFLKNDHCYLKKKESAKFTKKKQWLKKCADFRNRPL